MNEQMAMIWVTGKPEADGNRKKVAAVPDRFSSSGVPGRMPTRVSCLPQFFKVFMPFCGAHPSSGLTLEAFRRNCVKGSPSIFVPLLEATGHNVKAALSQKEQG